MPTNAQFTKRGVKESGYVSLKRRGCTNCSIIFIFREKIIPDAFKKERADVTTKQLQCKKRIKFLIRELLVQQQKIQDKYERDCNIFKRESTKMKKAIAGKIVSLRLALSIIN